MSPAYKIGEDGKEILASEMYFKKEEVQADIEMMRRCSAEDKKYIRKESNTGKPYFVLIGEDEEPIGTGEFYPSQKAMEKGIRSVKKIGPSAPIIDEVGG